MHLKEALWGSTRCKFLSEYSVKWKLCLFGHTLCWWLFLCLFAQFPLMRWVCVLARAVMRYWFRRRCGITWLQLGGPGSLTSSRNRGWAPASLGAERGGVAARWGCSPWKAPETPVLVWWMDPSPARPAKPSLTYAAVPVKKWASRRGDPRGRGPCCLVWESWSQTVRGACSSRRLSSLGAPRDSSRGSGSPPTRGRAPCSTMSLRERTQTPAWPLTVRPKTTKLVPSAWETLWRRQRWTNVAIPSVAPASIRPSKWRKPVLSAGWCTASWLGTSLPMVRWSWSEILIWSFLDTKGMGAFASSTASLLDYKRWVDHEDIFSLITRLGNISHNQCPPLPYHTNPLLVLHSCWVCIK